MVEIRYEENDAVRLPNNIRQVGMPGDNLKIYIEDYVITYLNQIAGRKPLAQKAALLLGEVVKKDKTSIFFVSAAIHIEQVEIKEDSLQLTSDMWAVLYAKTEQYFKDKHILGWFLSRPGQSVGLSQQIERVQAEQFVKKGMLFYALDPMDREDAFYIYMNGQLTRQQGYYVYYERNEAMQNYMVELHRETDSDDGAEQTGFQNRLLERSSDNQWKKEHYSKKSRRSSKWVTQAASVVLIVLIVAAVRKNLAGNHVAANAVVDDSVVTQVSEETTVTGNIDLVETIMQQAEASIAETSALDETEESDIERVMGTYQSYTVKAGDTLLKISRSYYQDDSYVDAIIELNQIEDPDYIYPGMVLQLP